MPRLPRLPRRQPRWQRAGAKTARVASELTAWFGVGFAAMAAADTEPGNSAMWAVVFLAVIGAGWLTLRAGPRIVRAIRHGRTPKRHRGRPGRTPISSQWTSAPRRRFRRG